MIILEIVSNSQFVILVSFIFKLVLISFSYCKKPTLNKLIVINSNIRKHEKEFQPSWPRLKLYFIIFSSKSILCSFLLLLLNSVLRFRNGKYERNERFVEKTFSEFESMIGNVLKLQIESLINSPKEEFNGLIKSKFSEVDVKLQAIEKSQKFLSKRYDKFDAQVNHVLKENTKLRDENKKLFSRIKELERRDQIRAKSIDDLQQHGRREMVEIS